MAQKLKIIPLGGLNEIGKNLTVYEYGKDMIMVDCGMGFPDDEMYGVDVVIPDVTWLEKNKSRLRGIFLTHGHEDHIGALPYILERVSAPVYATRLTVGLAELKLREHDLLDKVKLVTVAPGETVTAGSFQVEFIHVNHSIADSVAFAVTTPLGTVVHTGDFKIDVTPISGEMADLTRFGELGKQGVLALLMDSTNVERPGWCPSESRVYERLDNLFKDCDKRIILTTFSSNIDRIRQVIDLAARYRRKVGITGRSMENAVAISAQLGYMDLPEGILVDMKHISGIPKNKVVIISTGSQGESMSALYRMAFSEHKQVDVGPGDRVIISASSIPGNETMITRVIDELFAKGAEVVYERGTGLHVSGHACQEELKMIYALTRPRFFIPVHGERRMLFKSAEMIEAMGHDRRRILIGENGRIMELSARTAKLGETVPAGKVLLDGVGAAGDVGSVVLRDRKHLAEEGMLVVVMTLSGEDASLVSGPDLISRGFVYEKESDQLMEELRRLALESLAYCEDHNITDWASIKAKVRSNLSGYLFRTTKRSPMILPVIMEV